LGGRSKGSGQGIQDRWRGPTQAKQVGEKSAQYRAELRLENSEKWGKAETDGKPSKRRTGGFSGIQRKRAANKQMNLGCKKGGLVKLKGRRKSVALAGTLHLCIRLRILKKGTLTSAAGEMFKTQATHKGGWRLS